MQEPEPVTQMEEILEEIPMKEEIEEEIVVFPQQIVRILEERIIDRNTLEYLIEWSDQEKQDSWVNVRNLRNCEILLKCWNSPFPTKNFNYVYEGCEVESVLDRKFLKSSDEAYYLVHWKNYSSEYDSWESASNLVGASKLVKEYEKNHMIEEREEVIAQLESELETRNIPNFDELEDSALSHANEMDDYVAEIRENVEQSDDLVEAPDVSVRKGKKRARSEEGKGTSSPVHSTSPKKSKSSSSKMSKKKTEVVEISEDEEENEFSVESIVGHKKIEGGKGTYLYRIKWLGYPSSQNSWEPMENLEGCMDLLVDYHAENLLPPIMSKSKK